MSAALAPLLAVACSSAPVAHQPTMAGRADKGSEEVSWSVAPGERALVLGNSAGVRVALVPVRSSAEPNRDDTFLLRRSGVDDELDELVFIAQRRPGTSGHGYYASIHGQALSLLSKRSEGPSPWRLVQPNQVRQWTALEPVAEDVQAEDLLAQHREQEASGRMNQVAPRSRPDRQRAQDELFAAHTATMRTLCGVEATIDWETVEERWFDELSVSRSCSRMAESVVEFCQLHPHRLLELQEKGPIVCAFNGDPREGEAKLREAEGNRGLVFSPGASQQSYADIDLPLLRSFGEEEQLLRSGELHIVVRLGLERLAIFGGKGDQLYPVAAELPILSTRFRSENLLSGASLARLSRAPSGWSLQCGDNTIPLVSVIGAEREQALPRMTYHPEPKFKREPYFLARDSRGIYYYVDRDRREFGGQSYRIFVGPRGQMALSKLKGLVDDSEGTLFSTDRGELRLLVGASQTTGVWIRGKKETTLTTISVASDRELIFDELGVYFGEDLGLLCDAVGHD